MEFTYHPHLCHNQPAKLVPEPANIPNTLHISRSLPWMLEFNHSLLKKLKAIAKAHLMMTLLYKEELLHTQLVYCAREHKLNFIIRTTTILRYYLFIYISHIPFLFVKPKKDEDTWAEWIKFWLKDEYSSATANFDLPSKIQIKLIFANLSRIRSGHDLPLYIKIYQLNKY